EAEQTYPEVVLRRRVPGRQRQRRLEFDNRLLVTPEPRQGEAAIELRLRMTRYRGQNLVECPEGILRAPQRHERVAALMQRVGVAGLQRQRLVKTLERLLISLERVQHDAEIDPSIWRAGVDPERGSDQPIGFSGLSALSFDRTEEIERVELVGHRLQHPGVDLLRLAQAALLLQRHGIAQRQSEIRQALRWCHGRRSHVTAKRSKTRDSCHPTALPGPNLGTSIRVALPLAPARRGLRPVIGVRTAKSAVAGNHLLHAHLEGWDGAIVRKCPTAPIRARAPRTLHGLAGAKVEQYCRRRGAYDENESHGRLHLDDVSGCGPRMPLLVFQRRTTAEQQIQGSRDVLFDSAKALRSTETTA